MTNVFITPEQAKLSGHAQDAFHYALLASGDTGLSSFVGDRGTVRDARDEGYPDSPRGLALYALARSIHYATQAGIAIPFRWRPSPKSRRTLAQVRAAGDQLLVAVRNAAQAVGWNAYNDGPLADYPDGPGAEGAAHTKIKYAVNWDNGSGNACGTFPQQFDTEAEAEAFGANWKAEMVAIDPAPAEAEEEYTYEVIEAHTERS